METDTAVDVTTKAWEGFIPGNWTENIDVRDFIQKNYTPYEGDASFLAGPTDKTLRVWNTLESTYLSEERNPPTSTRSPPVTSARTTTSSSACRPTSPSSAP